MPMVHNCPGDSEKPCFIWFDASAKKPEFVSTLNCINSSFETEGFQGQADQVSRV